MTEPLRPRGFVDAWLHDHEAVIAEVREKPWPLDPNAPKVFRTNSFQMLVHRDLLMDYGLIPDDRPPRPRPSRRTRLRWWWRDKRVNGRERVALKIAPWLTPDE
jgi:hypothetical protein